MPKAIKKKKKKESFASRFVKKVRSSTKSRTQLPKRRRKG